MNRDLKFYFLFIGLPALLLALGGLRLLSVESARAHTLGRDALQAKATLAVSDVRRNIREYVDGVLSRVEQLPEGTTNYAEIVQTEPLVRAITPSLRTKGTTGGRRRAHVQLEPIAVLVRVPGWLEAYDAEL